MRIKYKSQLHFQRLVLGVICGLLPVCSVLFGIIGADSALLGDKWWYSISATYYANSNVWIIGSLVLASFFFFTYKGYDLGDRVLTIISAVSSICIIIFPCFCTEFERVGLFMLPVKLSSTLHNISASVLFISFAIMILTQFTKGKDATRNRVYYICGVVIVAFMISQVVTSILKIEWATIVNEFFMLEAFAVAWITKSKAVFFQIKKGDDM